MAYFPVNVLDNAIKAMPTVKAISNTPIATFDTDIADRLVNLQVAVTATQSGTGTPSPSNPRTINGFSACDLSVNGTTHTINFGQTVYGGSLDVISGKFTLLQTDYILSNLSWSYEPNYQVFYANMPSNSATTISGGITDCICEQYQLYNGNFTQMPNYSMTINNATFSPSKRIVIKNTDYTNPSDFTNAVNNVLLVYKLETEQIFQKDSIDVQSIVGNNNIYAGTGDIIDLKYVLSVGQAIS